MKHDYNDNLAIGMNTLSQIDSEILETLEIIREVSKSNPDYAVDMLPWLMLEDRVIKKYISGRRYLLLAKAEDGGMKTANININKINNSQKVDVSVKFVIQNTISGMDIVKTAVCPYENGLVALNDIEKTIDTMIADNK